jgi:DMSO/TMAO reductase YedYZ heme-binding membrane subunit
VKGDPTLWILARAAGFTAYGLLTASVLAGLVLRSRPAPGRLRPRVVADVHRLLAVLGLGALALHAAALALDGVARISPIALVVPGIAPRMRLAVAVGVLAGDLMILVAASSGLRRRIGFRVWRRIHWLTYAVFAAASAHGIMAGTDARRQAVVWMYAVAIAAVAGATAWRAMTSPARTRRPAARQPSSTAARPKPKPSAIPHPATSTEGGAS